MATLVSTICEHCLQSVEIALRSPNQTKGRCPACRSSVEIRAAIADDPTGEFDPPAGDGDTAEYDPDGPSRKVNAWSAVHTDRVGRFMIKKWLGSGGYGDVYRAYDERCKRFVALKVLRDEQVDARRKKRFEDEAFSAAKLSHEGVVRLFDRGFDDGKLWIAYELVPGPSLADEMKSRRFTTVEAVEMVLDIARALTYVHSQKLTHRDVKPANILIDDQGRPKITDLGLAKRMDIESGVTETTSVMGSRDYMSPEQAAGLSRLVDGRSDVYSLGVIFFELLTGMLPSDRPDGDSPARVPRKALTRITPRTFDPTVPEELDRICATATELDLNKRFESVGRFAEELEGWLVGQRKTVETEGRNRRRLLLAVAGPVVAGVLGFGMWRVWETGAREMAAQAAPIAPKTPTVRRVEPSYLGNPNSRTVHHKSCPHLKNMTAEPIRFKNLEEATAQAFKNCSTCHPEQRAAEEE